MLLKQEHCSYTSQVLIASDFFFACVNVCVISALQMHKFCNHHFFASLGIFQLDRMEYPKGIHMCSFLMTVLYSQHNSLPPILTEDILYTTKNI